MDEPAKPAKSRRAEREFEEASGKLAAVRSVLWMGSSVLSPAGGRPFSNLAFDPGLGRLYVSSESGTVTVLQKTDHDLRSLGQLHMPHAHAVSVDPMTHLVYFPLENVSGHPLLRIMRPTNLR